MGAKRDRDELLESIAKSREEIRDEETGNKPEVEETEEQEVAEDVSEDEEVVDEEETEEAETTEDEVEESQEVAEEEELVTIKVDGKEEKVPLSKIKDAGIRTFQKETAADKRLQEVSEKEKQLQQQLLWLQQQAQAQQPQQPQKKDADPRISKWTEAIRYGDEEEAQQALQELIQYGNENKGADPDEVLRAVDAQLKTHAMQQRLEAPEEQGGYKDVIEDPYLKSIASQQIDQIIQARYRQTGVLSPATWDDYQYVCNEVRNWKRGFEKPATTVNLQERAEKKRNLDNVKSTSARQQPEPEEKPPTTAEVIRNMRKQRVGGAG